MGYLPTSNGKKVSPTHVLIDEARSVMLLQDVTATTPSSQLVCLFGEPCIMGKGIAVVVVVVSILSGGVWRLWRWGSFGCVCLPKRSQQSPLSCDGRNKNQIKERKM